jgi:hypothetical protein
MTIPLNDELKQIKRYRCVFEKPWQFTSAEIKWLQKEHLDLVRYVWGYWNPTVENQPLSYEERTHQLEMEGGRALQEYTDVLFRILYHVLKNNYDSVFFTDAVPKISSQTGFPLSKSASESARRNMHRLLAEYLQETGVETRMRKLAECDMLGTSAGFACLVYTARQLLRMGESVEMFPTIDAVAELWYKKLEEIE